MIGYKNIYWTLINKIIVLMYIFFNVQICLAHPPGLSSSDFVLSSDRLNASFTFALEDIEAFVPMDSDQDAEVSKAELESVKFKIAALVASDLKIKFDRQDIKPISPGKVTFEEPNNVHIEYQFLGTPANQIIVQIMILKKFTHGHKQFVTFKNSLTQTSSEKLLNGNDAQLTFDLQTTSFEVIKATNINALFNTKKSTFVDFLLLGIEHIITGYDHLLFLFSLLVVTFSFWPAIKIITCFTIAHSITLALAGFNIVNLSSNIVEPLIAATIIYVGLENLIRGNNTKYREWLTFCFGLIHGFGFAAVLREMGISSFETGIMVPLFSFNLGVEAGQIVVASIILPIIWWLHRKPLFKQRLTPICSVITSLTGIYWFIERTLLS